MIIVLVAGQTYPSLATGDSHSYDMTEVKQAVVSCVIYTLKAHLQYPG